MPKLQIRWSPRPHEKADNYVDKHRARQWVLQFVTWYNHVHRHSAIQYVTPVQRHQGEDREILARRQKVYRDAKARNPRRWSGAIRNWTPIGAVYLNPEEPELHVGYRKAA